MIPTVPRIGRYVLLIGLVCLVAFWTYHQQSSICFLNSCHDAKASVNNAGLASSSPVLGLGGGTDLGSFHPSRPLPPPSSPESIITMDLSFPDAPFISWPLARLCVETSPRKTPGLVFVCDNNSGGIGNIRNFILTCLRYAIEAGAEGIVLPTIQTRSENRLSDLFKGEKLPFGHFFDERVFRDGLKGACPEFEIYKSVNSVPGVIMAEEEENKKTTGDRNRPYEMITPKNLGMRGGCDPRDLNRHTDQFGAQFHAWLAERPGKQSRSTKLIRFNWGVQWEWPVYRDGPEFVATFGGLLRFRADILDLGKKTVEVMEKRLSLVSQGAQSSQREKGEEVGFLGVHLRTENDALSSWPSFGEQTNAYLARASRLKPPPRLAYVATGNATEAARFAALADAQGLWVVTKHQVLEEADETESLKQLAKMSWDQQALVDFVVLLHAAVFVGVSPSSFSMNVALKRHLRNEGIDTRPWRVGSEEGDGRSWLVGRYVNYWEDWLFMYDSLWP